jgi:hypothetical protein
MLPAFFGCNKGFSDRTGAVDMPKVSITDSENELYGDFSLRIGLHADSQMLAQI